MRDPDDDGWDADGFDDGGTWPEDGGPVGSPGARPTGGRTGPGTFRPGLEALRLAIHRPEAVAHRLEAVLFCDDLQQAAFVALMEADDLPQAIDTAPADVRALLLRLVVEEPIGDADEVVMQLVRDAARRQLAEATREARTSPEVAVEAASASVWVQELDDPATAAGASDRLVAWLAREGTWRR